MAADFSEAGAQAASLALKMGSAAVDTVVFIAGLGEELPVIKPVLKTLEAIREKVETVKTKREELAALQERCTYITACFIVKSRRNPSSEIDVVPMEGCLDAALRFVERCSQRGKVLRVLKASSDKDEIAALNARVDRLTSNLGLAGIAILEGKADNMKTMLQKVLQHLHKTPAKQATVPKGAPARKSWHVERRDVMETVFRALTGGTGPRLVGLVGHSGSGKTTAASEIVRSTEVREAFSDGIVWLTANDGAKDRLSSLMLQLARMVHEDIGCSVGRAPTESDDGAAYVKQRMMGGQRGSRLKCLVVADNVWEEEVISSLLETGMWVLLSTRDESLVNGLRDGEAVGVDQLSAADAESVLRRAAELAPGARLPDDAVVLVELCGRVAMDLAFVGRWSTVRGRQDKTAWAAAAKKVRAEMGKLGGDPEDVIADAIGKNRRRAILRASFEDLAIGSDDERVPRLYLSLAVLPDGWSFPVRDAAVLLYDRTPSAEDEVSARGVVECLERWSVLRSSTSFFSDRRFSITSYYMHDAHSGFARENLMDHGGIRRSALERWTNYLSSLDALRCRSSWSLEQYWLAVGQVGGHSCENTSPYAAALAGLDDSDPLLWENIRAVASFQLDQGDWEGASTTCRRMLQVEVGTANVGRCLEIVSLIGGLASRFLEAGRREEAEKLLRRSLGIQEAQVGLESLVMANTLHTLALCVRDAGGLQEAEELFRRCLGATALDPEGLHAAYTLHQLGVCVRQAGRLEEAEELLRHCLGIREAYLHPQDALVAYTLHDLGVCVREAGRPEEAEALLIRSLGILQPKLDFVDLKLPYSCTLHELGVCVREEGRLQEAEELLRRCLGIKEAKLGPEDVWVTYTLHELGVCVREEGRLEEAEELFRRCLAIKEAKLGSEDMQVAYTLLEFGVCVREEGRLEEAEELLRRCLAIKEAKLGPENVEVASPLHELGKCIRQAGRLEEAEGMLRRCLGIAEAKRGPEDVLTSFPLLSLGVCLRLAGRLEEAEELLRRSLSVRETKLSPKDVLLADSLHHLGVLSRETSRLREAENLLRRCLAIQEAASRVGQLNVSVEDTLRELDLCVREAGRLVEIEGCALDATSSCRGTLPLSGCTKRSCMMVVLVFSGTFMVCLALYGVDVWRDISIIIPREPEL